MAFGGGEEGAVILCSLRDEGEIMGRERCLFGEGKVATFEAKVSFLGEV